MAMDNTFSPTRLVEATKIDSSLYLGNENRVMPVATTVENVDGRKGAARMFCVCIVLLCKNQLEGDAEKLKYFGLPSAALVSVIVNGNCGNMRCGQINSLYFGP